MKPMQQVPPGIDNSFDTTDLPSEYQDLQMGRDKPWGRPNISIRERAAPTLGAGDSCVSE
ncbi:hypothetical protein RHECNPAF_12210031 [Rhizobium etli CNPAF512]|nr:hypothetical protein RHECNPAF_12210031 [Rhizobium etli CNPAF512]